MLALPAWLTPRVIGYGVAVLAVIGALAWIHHAIYQSGYQACEAKYDQAMSDAIKHAGEEARAIALEDAEVMQQRDKIRTERQIVYRDRQVEVIKHVQANCSLDAVGLGLLNDAISGAATKTPSTGESAASLLKTPASP